MPELPSGVVTFVFTDLVESTRLWDEYPDAMGAALARHDAILREAVEAHGGTVIKSTGDGGYAVFGSAHTAVATCVAAARALAAEPWGETGRLHARTGIHTGVAEERDGDYFGPTLNRASRLMSAAHGEQIVISQRTSELVRDALSDELMLIDLGEHRFDQILPAPNACINSRSRDWRRSSRRCSCTGRVPGRDHASRAVVCSDRRTYRRARRRARPPGSPAR